MFGMHLAVDELDALALKLFHEFYECEFTGIALSSEHAFTKENPSDPYAVEATCQLSVFPCFRTDGMSMLVQFLVGFEHRLVDPGAELSGSADAATLRDHFVKSLIDGEFESIAFDEYIHTLAHIELFRYQYESWIRCVPMRR